MRIVDWTKVPCPKRADDAEEARGRHFGCLPLARAALQCGELQRGPAGMHAHVLA